MERKTIALIAVVLLAGLAGCVGGDETTDSGPKDEKVQDDGRFDDVDRFIDREAGVVCYKFTGFEKGGLSCVPIEQTNFAEEDI